jgi:hypothetical protein
LRNFDEDLAQRLNSHELFTLNQTMRLTTEEKAMADELHTYRPPIDFKPGDTITVAQAIEFKRALVSSKDWSARYCQNGGNGPEGQQLLALDKIILGFKD